jgi:hypothetical protein
LRLREKNHQSEIRRAERFEAGKEVMSHWLVSKTDRQRWDQCDQYHGKLGNEHRFLNIEVTNCSSIFILDFKAG